MSDFIDPVAPFDAASLPGTEFLVRRLSDLTGEVHRLRDERSQQAVPSVRVSDCLEHAPVACFSLDSQGQFQFGNRRLDKCLGSELIFDGSAVSSANAGSNDFNAIFGNATFCESLLQLVDGQCQESVTPDGRRFNITRASTALDPSQTSTYWLEALKGHSDSHSDDDSNIHVNGVAEHGDSPLPAATDAARLEHGLRLADAGLWDVTVSATDWLSDGGVTWFSPSLFDLLNLNKNQLPQSLVALLERVHAADRAVTYTAFRQMFSGTSSLDHRCRIQHRDGRYQWFRFSSTELERKHNSVRVIGLLRADDSQQQHLGYIASHVRATIQSAAEKSSRLREDLYEHAPDMIISVCATTGIILDCNQTICEKTNFSKAELVGRPVIEMYSPSCWSQAKAATDAFLQTGHIENINLEVRRKGGGVIEVNVNVSAIRAADGTITATRAVWRDVTEIRNDEREQRQKETKLAHVMRIATLGELATGIAHEVNQPLASIAAYASGVLRRLEAQQPTEEISNAVVKIRDEADRAGAIIRRMREFVRQGGARIEIVELRELIDGIIPLLHAGEGKLHIQVACDEIQLLCDPIQIQQVLLNLIKNADDAIAGAPPQTPEIKIQVRELTDCVEVRVIDNARTNFSLPSDKFFESFFTTKSDGIGLGLPLSRSFIEAHGGKLWFEKNPKGGASFVFTIPLTDGLPKSGA